MDAIKYAEMVTGHVSLEESIFSYSIILKSLTSLSKHDECIAKGVELLKQLEFPLTLCPTKDEIIGTMVKTSDAMSGCSVEEIVKAPMIVEGDMVHRVVTILEGEASVCLSSIFKLTCLHLHLISFISHVAIFPSSNQVRSPLLPLTTCAIVDYTIKRGVCGGSAMAFALFGMFLIHFQGDYASAKKCSQVAKFLTEKHSLSLLGLGAAVRELLITQWTICM